MTTRMLDAILRAAGSGLVAFCLLACRSQPEAAADAQVEVVDRCALTIVDARDAAVPRPPALTSPARPVRLPDRIGQRLSGRTGIAWYRCPLAARSQASPRAILLAHVNSNAVVYLNGQWLGQGGRFREPQAHTWNRPLLFAFDAARLRPRDNWLDVGVLLNGSMFSALSVVRHGSYEALHALARPRLINTRVAEASSLVSLAACLFFGAFGLALRDSRYLLLSGAALFCSLASLNFHCLEPPVPAWVFNTGVNVCLQWMVSIFAIFGLHLVGLRWRLVEAATLAYSAGVGLAGLCLDGPAFERHLILWHAPPTLLCFAVFGIIGLRRRVLTRPEFLTSLITASLLLPIGLHDLLLQHRMHSGVASLETIHLIPHIGPITLVGFGAVLLTRFIHVYQRAQRANLELQAQVESKRLELEEKYARVQELEQDRAILAERTRLQREVHDGIGGHLVAMLAVSERDAGVAAELREIVHAAIDDMRLLVTSMDAVPQDLTSMLAELRARLEPRLRAQGLRFHWDVDAITTRADMPRAQLLQVARIVQESITNILKHAAASVVHVQARRSDGPPPCLSISIGDDGCGMPSQPDRGRGLDNMRARAEQLGGRLEIVSSHQGTNVRLLLPLEVQ